MSFYSRVACSPFFLWAKNLYVAYSPKPIPAPTIAMGTVPAIAVPRAAMPTFDPTAPPTKAPAPALPTPAPRFFEFISTPLRHPLRGAILSRVTTLSQRASGVHNGYRIGRWGLVEDFSAGVALPLVTPAGAHSAIAFFSRRRTRHPGHTMSSKSRHCRSARFRLSYLPPVGRSIVEGYTTNTPWGGFTQSRPRAGTAGRSWPPDCGELSESEGPGLATRRLGAGPRKRPAPHPTFDTIALHSLHRRAAQAAAVEAQIGAAIITPVSADHQRPEPSPTANLTS